MLTDAQAALETVNEYKQDLNALKAQVDKLNQDVAALQEIVSHSQNGGYITGVEAFENEGESGWIITFNDGASITIYNGKDGKDGKDGKNGTGEGGGYVPELSVRQDADGVWYWVLDGEWLLDSEGNRIPASGHDGKDGKDGADGKDGQDGQNGKDGQDGKDGADGITPQLKIEDGYWYISYDNGQTWNQLGKATGNDGKDGQDGKDGTDGKDGKDGDSFFQNVDLSDPNYVVFILADGSTFKVPRFAPVVLNLSIEDGKATISANETISINYTLENATDATKISASSDGNYVVKVIPMDKSRGTIQVTSPALYTDGYINVLVDNGAGYVSLTIINFEQRNVNFSYGLSYSVSASGGTVNIPLTSNFDYRVEIPWQDQSWLSIVQTKGQINGTIIVNVAANESYQARVGHVYILPTDGGTYRKEVEINQSSAVFSMSRGGFVLPQEAGSAEMTVTSTRGLKVSVPADVDWLIATASNPDGNNYTITLEYTANNTSESRATEITFFDATGNNKLGAVGVVQTPDIGEELNAMKMEVRANYANDYTVYLPIVGDYSYWVDEPYWQTFYHYLDCYIDWGDGSVEHLTSDTLANIDGRRFAAHHYEETEVGQMYNVIIRGKVPRFYAGDIPEGHRTDVRAIRQWGNLGIIDMNNAFANFSRLEFLAADTAHGFADTRSFGGAFYNCVSLETIDKDLFVACTNATSFDWAFYGCTALTTIPDGLMDNLVSAQNLGGMFSNCTALTYIPDRFLVNCKSLKTIESMFSNCTSLAIIPDGLLAGCESLTNINSLFSSCEALKTVPEGLFAECTNVTSFYNVFNSSGLIVIPAKLFENNVKATDFGRSFRYTQITSIPVELFTNCRDITSVYETFDYCSKLKDIPVGLFDYNRRIVDFQYTFRGVGDSYYYYYDNSGAIGESPYTIIDGRKYHLYERKYNEDNFVVPLRTDGCFSSRFSDYQMIPRSWGGNANDNNYKGDSGEPEGYEYDNWN